MEMNNKEMILVDEGLVANLATSKNQYCSIMATSKEDKIALFNATNNPKERIGDLINMPIKIKHIYAEEVECKNEQTGELNVCPRIVLIDEDMIGYTSVSFGIYSAVKKIMAMFGEPSSWDEPLEVVVKQVGKGDKKILTLELA